MQQGKGQRDSLSGHRERDVRRGVHPVSAEIVRASGGPDACEKARTRIGDAAREPLSLESPVEVVNVAGGLATCEEGVENHDGSAVYDQAYGGRKVFLEAQGKVVQGAKEELAR